MCDNSERQIPNPYLAAIKGRRAASADAFDKLRTFLDDAIALFEQGVWIGGGADDFYAELVEMKRDARNVADGADREFEDAIKNQPEEVGVNSWQAHWRHI